MITVNLIGGLGNQMFQYAFGKALARRMGCELTFDVADFSWYAMHEGLQIDQLGALVDRASDGALRRLLGWRHQTWARRLRLYKRLPSRHTVVEPFFQYCSACAQSPDGSYLVGYWHSYRYFSDCARDVRTDFGSGDVDLSAFGSLLEQITTSESVAIHVRRGDYVSTTRGKRVLGPCSAEYYASAIALMRSIVPNAKFFVFSDEPESVASEKLIVEPHILVNVRPRPPAFAELRLMTKCKHFIIANSSFSWWAAWLASYPTKVVMAPQHWFRDASLDVSDLFPADWLIVR
ncbi:MAG: alpha-1,2-fucosyltransferase [Steroidobacteraceae bacterium]